LLRESPEIIPWAQSRAQGVVRREDAPSAAWW
jgi:hypothetical protein